MAVSFSLSLPLYVVRRGEMLYFRMRIPSDLQRVFQTTEVSLALRTNNPREAGRRAQRLAWLTTDLFDDIRGGEYQDMTHEEIRRLVADWLRETLEEDELRRIKRGRPRTIEEVEDEDEILSGLKHDALEALAVDDYRMSKATAQGLLEERGISLGTDSVAFRTLCRELMKAMVTSLQVAEKRNRGDYTEPVQLLARQEGSQGTREKDRDEGPLLSEVLKVWVEDKIRVKEWTERTRLDNEPMVKDFIEMVGDMPIGRLAPEHMRDARERFMRIPKNRTQTPAYAKIPLRELSDMDIPEGKLIGLQTLHNRAVKIGGFLNWAKDRGYPIMDGLETVMKFKKQRRKVSDARAVFTPEDLARIFNPETYLKETKGEAPRFWVPLIGLCSGMRLEEICQLYLTDIREEKGVLCFDVNEEEDKSVKTLSGKRLVPVSPVLMELGFMDYVKEVHDKGADRLFPGLEKTGVSGKYGDKVGKWFGRYLKKVGVKDETQKGKKVFHSFRHTFANACKQKGLEVRKVKEVIGHEGGKDMTMDHYAKAYGPDVLYRDVISVVVPEVDLRGLKNKGVIQSG